MNNIRHRLSRLRENDEQALIAFIMSALPEEELCLDCIKALEQGGCDILELGVPFSDPLADGEVIERFHHQGIERGLNMRSGLEFAHKVTSIVSMPVILFSYYNPIYCMGIDHFMQEGLSAGIEALIIPDLPLDEMSLLSGYDMEAIPMLAPSSPDERVKMAAALEPAFIYCVSVRGVTGIRPLPESEIKGYLQRVRDFTPAPLALGFGISSPEQVKNFRGHADAVVTGTFLARIIEEYRGHPHLLPGRLEKEFSALRKAARK